MSSQKQHHPLAARQLSFIRTWAEWKQLWDAAAHVETLHGLLHVGFQVELQNWDDEGIERLKLYLETADGYADSDTFSSLRSDALYPIYSDRERIHTPLAKGWPEGALREVSRKAFTILCKSVFADDPKHQSEHTVPGVSYEPDWWRLLSRRDSMEKVLWFLRLNDDRYGKRRLYNAAGSYDSLAKNHRETFNTFAFDLARFILRWHYDGSGSDWRAALDEFKLAAVNILYGLGKLDLLLHSDYYKTLDEACRTRIHEIALTSWIHAEDYRQVKTMQEAVLAGSQAAKIFTLLGVMDTEQQRLDAVARLKRQRADTDRALRELQQ